MDKREVQRFRQQHTSQVVPNYIRLFDVIVSNLEADPDAIELLIQKTGMKNITYLKHILLQKLCDTLIDEGRGQDIQSGCLLELIIIKQLRSRNMTGLALKKWEALYKQCRDKKMATFIQLLLNERWQLSLAGREENSLENYLGLVETYYHQAEAYKNLVNMRRLESKIHALVKKSYLLEDHTVNEIKEFRKELKKVPLHISHFDEEYRILYFTCRSKLCLLEKDFAEALYFAREAYRLWEENAKVQLVVNPRFTIEFIKYYADLLFINKRLVKLKKLLAFIKICHFNNKYYLTQHQILIFLIENRYFNTIRQHEQVPKLYTKSGKFIDRWLEVCPADWKSLLLMGISISAYSIGKTSSALNYLYKYEKIYAKSFRKDTLSVLYLYCVVLTYELKDHDLFNAAYQRAYMHFYRNKEHRSIFLDILKPLKKAFGQHNINNRIEIFRMALGVIKRNGSNKSSQLLFSYFDFPGWFASKVQANKL